MCCAVCLSVCLWVYVPAGNFFDYPEVARVESDTLFFGKTITCAFLMNVGIFLNTIQNVWKKIVLFSRPISLKI